jgi:hypothetical protein
MVHGSRNKRAMNKGGKAEKKKLAEKSGKEENPA